MTEQILTQVEVDALLKGLSNGEIKTEADKTGDIHGAEPYDFANPVKAVRGKMPTLEMVNERFCRNVRTALFNLMRKTIDVAIDGGVKVVKYEDFLRNIKVPSSLNIFQITTLRGQGLLVLDPSLVFLIVDGYFGGDGRFHARIEGRDFTNVEQTVIRRVVEVIFAEMNEVWKAIHPLEFKLVRAEMNPQFVNIISHTELVVTSSFRMEIESVSGVFLFCIPYASVEPIKDKLYGTHRVESGTDRKWADALREQVSGVPLTVSGEIGKARINVFDLMNLKAGDIIQLDNKAKDPVEVHVEGVPKFMARSGVMDNNYALQILNAVTEERG